MNTVADRLKQSTRAAEIERAHAAIKRAQRARVERLEKLNVLAAGKTPFAHDREAKISATTERNVVDTNVTRPTTAVQQTGTEFGRACARIKAGGPHEIDAEWCSKEHEQRRKLSRKITSSEQRPNSAESNDHSWSRTDDIDRPKPHAEYRFTLMREVQRIAIKQGVSKNLAVSWFPDDAQHEAKVDAVLDPTVKQQPYWTSSTLHSRPSSPQQTHETPCSTSGNTSVSRSHPKHQATQQLRVAPRFETHSSKGRCNVCQELVWPSQRRSRSSSGGYYHATCIDVNTDSPQQSGILRSPTWCEIRNAQTSPTVLLGMPDELLLQIFSHLQHKDRMACACVCQRFSRVASDASLWVHTDMRGVRLTPALMASIGAKQPKHLQLAWCEDVSTSGVLRLLRACGDRLVTLNVTGVTTITDATLCHVARVCSRLEALDLSWCHITNEGIEQLTAPTSVVTSLRALKLTCCSAVTDRAVTRLCERYAATLHTLDVCGCVRLTSYALRIISYSMRNLRVLALAKCHNVSGESVGLCLHYLRGLTDLNVRGCRQISDELFLGLTPHCFRTLECVCVAVCVHITDTTLKVLGNCVQLHTLDVNECPRVTDVGVAHLRGTVLDTLTSIDLSGTAVTSATVALLSTQAPRLRSLQLNRCCNVSIDSLEALVRHRNGIPRGTVMEVGVAGCLQLPARSLRLLEQSQCHVALSR
eukprot:m.208387 g.208387  ORF g.208387 m.208387 type:complete len:702 (+) comp18964_c0_seq1:232-2337(+)